jgi:hypothetical protein
MLFKESDRVRRVSYAQQNGAARVIMEVRADRTGQASSYDYELSLAPEQIIQCLLTLPSQTVQDAIGKVSGFDIAERVPELVKHLTAGAIAAPKTAATPQAEEEEDADDAVDDNNSSE